jgi:hypothetical protein
MDNFDIFSQICKHFDDREKISLTAITTIANEFKYKLMYVDQIDEKKIRKLPFYDNFESILISYVHEQFPKNVKRIHARCYADCAIYSSSIDFAIPTTVTHLILTPNFGYIESPMIDNRVKYFVRSLKTKIPNSITHLTFGEYFNNQPINDCIPNSVTYLKFRGQYFYKPIENCIPNSVIHLSLGYNRCVFKASLPSSVTHLKIGKRNKNNCLRLIGNEITSSDIYSVRIIKKYISSVQTLTVNFECMSSVD